MKPADSAHPAQAQNRWIALAVALVAFVVYRLTLAPSLYWGDGPDLVAAAHVLGVPHATGYPLYTLVGHVFTRVFTPGNVAFGMNLLSAIPSSAAVGLFYLLLVPLVRSRWIAAAGALLLAFSYAFWSQAVITEVYGLHMLFTVAILACVLHWDRRGDRRALYGAAVLYGLSFTHHLMTVLLAPALVVLAATSRHRGQFLIELPKTLPLFLAPLAFYAYLPWAASRHPPVNWGNVHDWDSLVAHVTGRYYWRGTFRITPDRLWGKLVQYAGGEQSLLIQQFGPWLLLLAPAGLVSLFRRHARLAAVTLVLFVTVVVYALNYGIYEVDVYYMPSHLLLALWIAVGLRWIVTAVRARLRAGRAAVGARHRAGLLLAAATLIPALGLARDNWEDNDRSRERDPLEHGRAELDALPAGAIVFGGGDRSYFPVMYAQYVERRRPDVTVFDFNDVLIPGRDWILPRLRSAGLVVRPPKCAHTAGRGFDTHSCLFDNLVADNVGRRRLFLLGAYETFPEEWLDADLRGYFRVVRTNLPVEEIIRRVPLPLGPAASPGKPAAVFLAESTRRPVLELRRCAARREAADPPGWLRLRYDWRVLDPRSAAPAEVQVLFTDPQGAYATHPDGTPQFHDTHRLAQGIGRKGMRLPAAFAEEFRVFVPPTQRGRPIAIQVGLFHAGRPLARAGGAPYTRVTDLPAELTTAR